MLGMENMKTTLCKLKIWMLTYHDKKESYLMADDVV